MAPKKNQDTVYHLDPSTLAAEEACSDVEDGNGQDVTSGNDAVHAGCSAAVVPSSVTSDPLSELTTPPLLSATYRHRRTLTGSARETSPKQGDHPRDTPSLSPSGSLLTRETCALSRASANDQKWVALRRIAEPNSAEAEEDVAAMENEGFCPADSSPSNVVDPRSPHEHASADRLPALTCVDPEDGQGRCCCGGRARRRSSSFQGRPLTEMNASVEARHSSRTLSTTTVSVSGRTASAHYERDGATAASAAVKQDCPTRVSRVSSGIQSNCGGSGGDEPAPSPLCPADSPLLIQLIHATSEPGISAALSRRVLSHSPGFFQSSLLLSLDEDAETQPAALDLPMTPQSYSHAAQSRGDSAQHSLMSSSRLAVTQGDVSSGSNFVPASLGASSGGPRRLSSHRALAATALSENGGWAAMGASGPRTLDENTDGVVGALQQWDVNGGSGGGGSRGSHGTGNATNTPLAMALGGRLGTVGGSLTPVGSFHLMGSYGQLGASAIQPADIPATPTDLSNLPCRPQVRSDRRHRRRSSDDDTSDEEEEGSERSMGDQESAPDVVETNVLQRTRTASVSGRGSYEVINEKYVLYDYELGKGSYSRVHLCYNVKDGHFYAAKVVDKVRLRRRQLRSDYDLFKVDQEITIMRQLQHTNIIGLREVIRDPTDRYVFLIMELAESKEVLSMRDNGDVVAMADGCTSYPEATVRHLARGVLHALMYAHYLGIAHRDVKPSNVLTTAQNTVKLCDFGVSVLVGEATMHLRREGSVAFLAPELLLSSEVDVSRYVSPALSSLGGSKDKAASESLQTTASNAAVELAEETGAPQETDEWDFSAATSQALPPPAPTSALPSARQNPPLPSSSSGTITTPGQQHSPYAHLVTPTAARQPTAEFNESIGATNSVSGIPPLSALSVAGPQRSLLASKPSQRTSSLSSRVCAAAPSHASEAIAQYASWLTDTCHQSTVDLFKGDVFSLGVTVFTLLLGHLPWRASNATSQLAAIFDEPDPFLRIYREAYGEAYTWPTVVRDACEPILAFTRDANYKVASRNTPVSRGSRYGSVERGGRAAEQQGTTSVEPLRGATEDKSVEQEEEVREAVCKRASTRQGHRGTATPPVPRSAAVLPAMPVLHRAHSLDVARKPVKSTSPHSSNLRSSKAGCTPDNDLITTTPLSATTGLRQSHNSGTVGSRVTPTVVTAAAYGVGAEAGTASSPLVGLRSLYSGTVTTQHEMSGHGTLSSFWHSVTEGGGGGDGSIGIGALPDQSVGNDLTLGLTTYAGYSGREVCPQEKTSQEELPNASVAGTLLGRESAQNTSDVRAGVAEVTRNRSGDHTSNHHHQLPRWTAVAERDIGSVSGKADTATTSAPPVWRTITATYHHGDSDLGLRVEVSMPTATSTAPPVLPSAKEGEVIKKGSSSTSLALVSEEHMGEATREVSDSVSHSLLSPPTADLFLATPARTEDDAKDRTSPMKIGYEEASNADEEWEVAPAKSQEPLYHDNDSSSGEESSVSATGNGQAAVPEEIESDYNEVDGADVYGDEDDEASDESDHEVGSEADIYEQLYEEGHPCRSYSMSETCPLPAQRGGSGDARAISAEAVDFVRACLTLDPVERRTVFELFHHPWIAGRKVDAAATDSAGESWLNPCSGSFSSSTQDGSELEDEEDVLNRPRTCDAEDDDDELLNMTRRESRAHTRDTSDRSGGDTSAPRDGFAAQDADGTDATQAGMDNSVSGEVRTPRRLDLSAGSGDRMRAAKLSRCDCHADDTAESRRPQTGPSTASTDSVAVLLSADSEGPLVAGTDTSLNATATTVPPTNGSDHADTATLLGVRPFEGTSASATSQGTVVLPLCDSSTDLLERLRMLGSSGANRAQHQPPLFGSRVLRSEDLPLPHHARQSSSASSRQPFLGSPYNDESNRTTSPTWETSVSTSPMTAGHHHARLHSRDSRLLTDGASLRSPALEDTVDRLILSGVSPSTTLNSSNVSRPGKATTLPGRSAATRLSSAAVGRHTKAATTSHVDSFLWLASGEQRHRRRVSVFGHDADDLDHEEDHEEDDAEGDGEELSTLTGSLTDLLASLPRGPAANAADAVRSPSAEDEDEREAEEEERLLAIRSATRPLMQPQQESALSSPMRRFLEKIAMRDRD